MIYSLVCHHMGLQQHGYKFQTMTFKRFDSLDRSEAVEILTNRIINNLNVTLEILKECNKNIWGYRFSSALFPLLTYTKVGLELENLPRYSEIKNSLNSILDFMKKYPEYGFYSMHPDQFCSITSDKPDVVENSIRELEFHANFLDMIGLPRDYSCPINIHLNSIPKSKTVHQVVDQVGDVLSKLSDSVKFRLVFENNDKPNSFWNTENLYQFIYKQYYVPITLDELHWKCFPDKNWCYEEAFWKSVETWKGWVPHFHYSESKSDKQIRSHADHATKEPLTFGCSNIIFDVELKMKDKAIENLENLQKI